MPDEKSLVPRTCEWKYMKGALSLFLTQAQMFWNIYRLPGAEGFWERRQGELDSRGCRNMPKQLSVFLSPVEALLEQIYTHNSLWSPLDATNRYKNLIFWNFPSERKVVKKAPECFGRTHRMGFHFDCLWWTASPWTGYLFSWNWFHHLKSGW